MQSIRYYDFDIATYIGMDQDFCMVMNEHIAIMLFDSHMAIMHATGPELHPLDPRKATIRAALND